jgi:hypothetical protein
MLWRGTPRPAEVNGDGGENNEEEQEEANTARPLREPRLSTRAERAAHEATHLPFRSWFSGCGAGRRDNPPHGAIKEDEESTVPYIMVDYRSLRHVGEET